LEFVTGGPREEIRGENSSPICSPDEGRVLCFQQQIIPVFVPALR
jgi:hypothetical protein